MKPLLPALTLALALVASEARAQPAATLRYRYVAGTTARYTTRTSQTMPGALGTTVTTSTHDVETVRVLPDGSAEQRMRIASMEMAGANVPAPVRERVTAAMRGLVIEYTVDARGRVAARRTVGEVPEDMRPVLNGVLESLDQLGAPLPEGPVARGGTWHDQRALHLAPGTTSLDMNVDTTYTLRQLRGVGPAQVAVLGVAMTIATPPGMAVRGVRMSGAGSATGESVLELGRGRVGRAQTTGSMRIQVAAGGRNIDLDTRFEHLMTPAPPAAPPRPPRPVAPTRPGAPARPATAPR